LNIDVADMLVSYELENKSFSPTMVHYVAMKGKSSVLKWIIKRMKEVNPDEYIEKLEETCSFGKQIGLVKVTPLVCAITCESIDTVSVLLKEGINQEDKCRTFTNMQTKDGRSKERKLKIEEGNSKSPLELIHFVKEKSTRVALRSLFRRNEKNKNPITAKQTSDSSIIMPKRNKVDINQNIRMT